MVAVQVMAGERHTWECVHIYAVDISVMRNIPYGKHCPIYMSHPVVWICRYLHVDHSIVLSLRLMSNPSSLSPNWFLLNTPLNSTLKEKQWSVGLKFDLVRISKLGLKPLSLKTFRSYLHHFLLIHLCGL